MSFVDDVLLQLRADVAQALGLPAKAVYSGRQAQKVTRTGFEVWLRPIELESIGRGGGNQLKVHPIELHLRLKALRESNQTGDEQLERVREGLRRLRERYEATRPFVQAVPDLMAIQVEEQSTDEDPNQDGLLDGVIVLRVLER